jgi:hypothetical protein
MRARTECDQCQAKLDNLVEGFMGDDWNAYREAVAWLRDFVDQKNAERDRVMHGGRWYTPQTIGSMRRKSVESAALIQFAEADSLPAFGLLVPLVTNSWNSASNAERWARGFAALAKFRAREGHCCPCRHHVEDGFKLGDWVSVQRYHKDFFPVERKRLLDAIGFVWDRRHQLWEQHFAALLNFKQREGHCYVPTRHRESGLKLGWWVATLRRNKKEISTERLTRSDKIDFVWNALRGNPDHRATKLRRLTDPNPLRLRA